MDEPKTFREKSGVERSAGRAESAGIPTIFVSHSGTYKRLVIVLRTRRTKAIGDLAGGHLPRLHLFTYFLLPHGKYAMLEYPGHGTERSSVFLFCGLIRDFLP